MWDFREDVYKRQGYNSIWTDEETDEWLQQVEDGIVVSLSLIHILLHCIFHREISEEETDASIDFTNNRFVI